MGDLVGIGDAYIKYILYKRSYISICNIHVYELRKDNNVSDINN
jgi:hypothetical protein